MPFSLTAEYALRAAVCLADHYGTPQTNRQIAGATRVPGGYLSKVLQSMSRAGLLAAQRGLGGGFSLTRPPDTITALDVVNAVDPLQRIRACPLGLERHTQSLCPLHRKIDDAIALIEDALGSSTLADLIDPTGRRAPLCQVAVRGKAATKGGRR